MKFLRRVSLLALASSMALAQAGSGSGQAQNPSVADELKALREAMAAQQAQITQQQQQMAQQQKQIETLQQALDAKTAVAPHVENAALTTTNAAPAAAVAQTDVEKPKESPLSFRIGGTEFTPGGFVDFENVFRTTNTGSNIATGFGGIPYSNTVQGHLTEFRTTGQYSRYNLKITGKYGANNVTGYIEGDFNGNDASNVFVTANAHTNRLRLYWLDLRRGNWEFLAGSSWGLLTPNRTGLSPMPADLALTLGEDANVHVGTQYTRAGTFRAVYHANDNFQWGFGIENPEQFIGAGNVIFPFAFNAQLGSQFDTTQATSTPNAAPDVNTKMAYDTTSAGRHFHLELGAMATFKKIAVLPIITPAPTTPVEFSKHTKIGGGVEAGLNYDLTKQIRIVGSGMWGNGIGRYLIGLAPDAVVVPTGTITNINADISLIHSGNAIMGVELSPNPKTQFGAYYGGVYAQRNSFVDFTNPVPGRIAGFGGSFVPTANRAIQEGSFDWTQTFWKNPQYGAVVLITQWSYLTRAPWFVPKDTTTGQLLAPKNAHLGMSFVSLRYVLP